MNIDVLNKFLFCSLGSVRDFYRVVFISLTGREEPVLANYLQCDHLCAAFGGPHEGLVSLSFC